jgi:DNA-binding CsgD family transcriptional regulator
MDISPLVGRKNEQSQLSNIFKRTADGYGQLTLLAGEAGTGKTRLATHLMKKSDLVTLSASANETATPPYGPFVDVFRSYLRSYPDGLSEIGPLKPYLAQLLPEISDSPQSDGHNTLIEAIRVALEAIANENPTIIFFDDLQWADNATLEVFPKLAEWLIDIPLSILGTYRNDEVPRGHPIRQLKNDLRRANQFYEITIGPLSMEETQQLAENHLQSRVSPALLQALYLKTQGVPFFIEELIAALEENQQLDREGDLVDLLSAEDIPLPDTVRDAILIRFDKLSSHTKDYLEIAAVVGQQFRFELIADLTKGESYEEAIHNGFLLKTSSEQGQFRHALTREAIYKEINWSKARDLHRKIADHLERSNTAPDLVAEHWHAGKELQNARRAYVRAVDESCKIHAYADAARAAKQAIDLWPEGEDEMGRLTLLDELGRCAQVSGSFHDATRAWREAAESYSKMSASQEYGEVQRNLATVYGLQGTWEKAMTARQLAADAFLDAGSEHEATNELLSLVSHLHSSGKYERATPFAEKALNIAEESKDATLSSRAMGLLGSLKTRTGSPDEGLAMAQAGLSLALAENSFSVAAELYQRLGAIMEHLGNYVDAEETYATGVDFCQMHGLSAYAHLCQACISVVYFQKGDFQEVVTLNSAVLSADDAPDTIKLIARTLLGLAYSFMGEVKLAREELALALASSTRIELVNAMIFCHWGLAILDWRDNDLESAGNHARAILADWSHSDESHYSIPALRFAATFFSSIGDGENTRASADALTKIATTLSTYESLAGLSHALGEVAWANEQLSEAIEHFNMALELMADKDIPLEEAETKYRAGLVHLADDQKKRGVELLQNAYQLTHSMGERFYSRQIIDVLDQQGVSIEKVVGKRKATRAKFGGLTRRQLEVLKLVAEGMTNQQIAESLFISPRTVDMHVSNVLSELGCRSRAEAVNKANELGLIA